MLEIMEKYGWDWYQYNLQPYWVIGAIRDKMSIEAKLADHATQNLKPKSDG